MLTSDSGLDSILSLARVPLRAASRWAAGSAGTADLPSSIVSHLMRKSLNPDCKKGAMREGQQENCNEVICD